MKVAYFGVLAALYIGFLGLADMSRTTQWLILAPFVLGWFSLKLLQWIDRRATR